MSQNAKKRKREQDDTRPQRPGTAATPAPGPGVKDLKAKAKVAATDEATLRSMGRKKAFKHAMDSPYNVKWSLEWPATSEPSLTPAGFQGLDSRAAWGTDCYGTLLDFVAVGESEAISPGQPEATAPRGEARSNQQSRSRRSNGNGS